MEIEDLENRTDKLKNEINNLLMVYCKETSLTPYVVECVATFEEDRLIKNKMNVANFKIDLGIKL